MRGVNLNPGSVPDDMFAVRMFLQSRRLVSLHRRRSMAVVDGRTALLQGDGPKNTDELMVALAGGLATRMPG